MQILGISHITFVVKDLARAAEFFCRGLGATEVYDSMARNFSHTREKFFVLGGVWFAAMEGRPASEESYQHLALQVAAEEIPEFERRLRAIGVVIAPSRTRVTGEGVSLYFYDFDGHLFELHSGSLAERLTAYAATR